MRFKNNRLREKHISFDEKTQGKICGNHQNSDREIDVENSAQTPVP